MERKIYKLKLYKPSGDFAGYLDVFNLETRISLEDFSSISFNIAAHIDDEGEENKRLLDVLDLYEVELEVSNRKYRFILRTLPAAFDDSGYYYSYEGLSLGSDLNNKIVSGWAGKRNEIEAIYYYIQKDDYNIYLTAGNDIALSFDKNETLPTNNPEELSEYIEIVEVREYEGITKKTPLVFIEKESVFFKRGAYYIEEDQGDNNKWEITIAGFSNNEVSIDGSLVIPQEVDIYYKIYLNPPFDTMVENDIGKYLISDAAEKAEEISRTQISSPNKEQWSVIEEYYSTIGVTIEDILQDLLIPLGWEFNVDNKIKDKKRSDFVFNNISMYKIIEEIEKSYDTVSYFSPNERKVFFYEDYKDIEGLKQYNNVILGEGAYLRSLSKNLTTEELATRIHGIGKNYIDTGWYSPTGIFWEDYSYYLDGYWRTIENENVSLHDILKEFFEKVSEESSATAPNFETVESRWMSHSLAEKIAKWQFVRNFITDIYFGEDKTGFLNANPTHSNYLPEIALTMGIIDRREKASKKLAKLEKVFIEQKAKRDSYKTLMNNLRLKGSSDADENTEEHYNYLSYLEYQESYELYNQGLDDQKQEIEKLEKQLFDKEFNSNSENDFAYLFTKIQDYLSMYLEKMEFDESNKKELSKFNFDYILQDDSIVELVDLFEKVTEYAAENAKPKVTLEVDIIDLLSEVNVTEEEKENIFTGDFLYVNFPMFNIAEKIQIKAMNINFDTNDVSLEISSVERYSKTLLHKIVKNLKSLGSDYLNRGKYGRSEDEKIGSAAKSAQKTLTDGVNTKKVTIRSGDNEEESMITFEDGNFTVEEAEVDPIFERLVVIEDKPVFRIDPEGLSLSIGQKNGIGYMKDGVFLGFDQVEDTDSEGNLKMFRRGVLSLKEDKDFLSWNGRNLHLGGNIRARGGTIGGWKITGDRIYTKREGLLTSVELAANEQFSEPLDVSMDIVLSKIVKYNGEIIMKDGKKIEDSPWDFTLVGDLGNRTIGFLFNGSSRFNILEETMKVKSLNSTVEGKIIEIFDPYGNYAGIHKSTFGGNPKDSILPAFLSGGYTWDSSNFAVSFDGQLKLGNAKSLKDSLYWDGKTLNIRGKFSTNLLEATENNLRFGALGEGQKILYENEKLLIYGDSDEGEFLQRIRNLESLVNELVSATGIKDVKVWQETTDSPATLFVSRLPSPYDYPVGTIAEVKIQNYTPWLLTRANVVVIESYYENNKNEEFIKLELLNKIFINDGEGSMIVHYKVNEYTREAFAPIYHYFKIVVENNQGGGE